MTLRFQQPTTTLSFEKVFDYPDEDLCLFKEFPHSHLVVPIISPGVKIACTCTLQWLEMYLHLYEPWFYTINASSYVYDYKTSLQKREYTLKFCYEQTLRECDFRKRFEKCNPTSINHSKFSFNSDNDIFQLAKWLQYILLVILQPIFTFSGLFNNLLLIWIITDKTNDHLFKEAMYKHIRINACFNAVYCLIRSFSLLNQCLEFNGSPYCSSIYQEQWAQYFKIIVVNFLGNSLKFCSNVSYLFFAISRFILIANVKQEHKLFSITKRIPLLFYMGILFLVALLLNLFRLFQYKINTGTNIHQNFPLERQDEVLYSKRKIALFDTLKIVNNFLNDIVCFVLNIAFDLFLLKYFNQDIRHKMHTRNKGTDNSDLEKKRKNVNRMIFVNGILFVVSHLPEFVSAIVLVVKRQTLFVFCYYRKICDDLFNEEAQVFSLISVVFQFYIFAIFNKNFQMCIKQLRTKCWQFLFRS